MRKSTTHLNHASRFLSTTVDSGSVIPTTCRRNSYLRALVHTFPLDSPKHIPHHRRSTLIRSMSTSVATIENLSLPATQVTGVKKMTTPTNSTRLQGSLNLFNLSETVVLADLDHAIQTRNADKAWSLFATLASKQEVPFTMCCSLYALLNFCKRLAGGAKQATKLRQRQLDQLLDYVEKKNSTSLFLSSIQEIPISSHKQLLRAIRVHDQKEAWHLFYSRIHKTPGTTIEKLPRTTCIKLMLFIMKDKNLDRNQLKSRLQLIALHGAGTSEYDSRYMSAADVLRIANICHGYEKSKQTAHDLIDEFVMGIMKKKQSIRADALDELIWRILGNQDISKARHVLDTIQTKYAKKIDVNEMVFVNLMNAYRRRKNYHESLKLFEQLLVERRPTTISFNAILQIFAAQGSADRASYIFESMNQLGVKPDTATYTELIRANTNNLKTCIHYYELMIQNDIQPNVYTYSALIEASSRKNDIKSVLGWFQTMLNLNVQPNQVVISCILKSLSKQHAEYPNMPEAVIQIAHQAAMAGIKTDAALYTILLKMQAESIGIEGALKIHRDMLAQSVEPNAYTYTILIDACGKNRMPETAEKIFELMKKSIRHQPNTVTYTVLMDAWTIVNRREKVEALIIDFLKECKSDNSGRLWLDNRIRERLKSRCC
ncbi:hypothetical protein EDC94DRAFT_623986 [Helicostylum pulchrum]|nr:hypothetical protein EDC94DRAFT_623986 [Helicostylum pulchrum]